jgi:hypothetical protein
MQIQIVVAYIVTNKEKVSLTKARAKQFPIKCSLRIQAAEGGHPQPEPIAKVTGKTLGDEYQPWFVLQEDKEAGYTWTVPAIFSAEYSDAIVKSGGWVDDLADIPTIILK